MDCEGWVQVDFGKGGCRWTLGRVGAGGLWEGWVQVDFGKGGCRWTLGKVGAGGRLKIWLNEISVSNSVSSAE